ncbi:putative phage tail assembly chaperone [Vibrio sp. DW001]|uniref:putative phage tail assembly chaperone n=1 Tax=Vibrio sp. DW001 TaxID=2912315 RepID=UPI0023AF781B|nr:putative phage tail assembly chaperone [Vibrio sp. DW001]WED29047.1 putative phage tail assembly chaperone [Vibrio sp. DW001]
MKTENKAVVLTIGATDFNFTPTVQDHNNYMNELMPNNKVAPMHLYLSRTVAPEQKEALVALLDTVPGLTSEIFAEVTSASKGGITVTLKNSPVVLLA